MTSILYLWYILYMEIIRVEKIPDELKKEFKSQCVLAGMTMREAFIRLMGLVVEERFLLCPIDSKEIEKEVEKRL